jgi:hypothetical protein
MRELDTQPRPGQSNQSSEPTAPGPAPASPPHPNVSISWSQVEDRQAMSEGSRGRRLRLSPARAMVLDVLHYSRKIPSQALARDCRLGRLVGLRKAGAGPKVGWAALFVRAYALLSCRHAVLRQCYMPWPWPHLYEHPHPVGRMTVSRPHDGEDRVFFAHCDRPDLMTVGDVQAWVDNVKSAPVNSIDKFRQQVTFSRVPTPLRRIAWWVTMNLSGNTRAERCGTFALTTVGSAGAHSIHPPSITVVTFTFGPIDEAGNVRVTMVYDHRVLDGLAVADFLRELEEILEGPVADELAALRGVQ